MRTLTQRLVKCELELWVIDLRGAECPRVDGRNPILKASHDETLESERCTVQALTHFYQGMDESEMRKPYRGRYAPSPTGDLHLGNLLAAMVAWARARQSKGEIWLRMEDLDEAREVPGAAKRILEDLAHLELDFDAGPQHPVGNETFVQSTSKAHYEKALRKLSDRQLLYGCTCSRKDLAQLASAPHVGEDGPPYPGFCRDAGHSITDTQPPRALRFRVPSGSVSFEDVLQGEYSQDVASRVGDFVVRRKDNVHAYQLAVVVDDGRQGITEVVRGCDLISSTPRQIQLFRALDYPIPQFAHLPLWVDGTGERLAKRSGSRTVRALLEAGESPSQILGRVGRALGVCSEGEKIRARDLAERMTPEVLSVRRISDDGPLPAKNRFFQVS